MSIPNNKISSRYGITIHLSIHQGNGLSYQAIRHNNVGQVTSTAHGQQTSEGLHPDGDHDGVAGVARFMELDRDIAAGDHFGDGETTRHGDVLQPHGQAAMELDGCGVTTAVECFEDSF